MYSLRKQPTFRDATTCFPVKWRLTNERRNPIQMTITNQIWVVREICFNRFRKHYPDLGDDAAVSLHLLLLRQRSLRICRPTLMLYYC